MNIVAAITGASGAIYGQRLVELLAENGHDVHLVISRHGRRLLADELGIDVPQAEMFTTAAPERIVCHDVDNIGAVLASGSYPTDGMVICPCSSNTLAAVASGLANTLITRAAQVCLKERRRLILCTREMPLSRIDIDNMAKVTDAGAIVCPMSPGFYANPKSVDDLVDFVVARILDLLGIQHALTTRWAGTVPTQHAGSQRTMPR